MQDTCNFEICALRRKLKIKTGWECPNYLETTWVNEKKENIITKDCAPKRTCLSINDVLSRILTLQKTDENSRNTSTELINTIVKAVNIVQQNPEAQLNMNINSIPEKLPSYV